MMLFFRACFPYLLQAGLLMSSVFSFPCVSFCSFSTQLSPKLSNRDAICLMNDLAVLGELIEQARYGLMLTRLVCLHMCSTCLEPQLPNAVKLSKQVTSGCAGLILLCSIVGCCVHNSLPESVAIGRSCWQYDLLLLSV